MSLAQDIQDLQTNLQAQLSKEALEELLASTQRLVESGIAGRTAAVGAAFPPISLHNAEGESVPLANIFARGNTVVSFFRGSWCPYCSLEMAAWRKVWPQMVDQGAQLIAISPMSLQSTAAYVSESAPEFPVLSDQGNRLASALGLVFDLEPKVREIYEQFGFTLPNFNGDSSWQLPVPATYVVDPQGIIRYRHVNADYATRAEPEQVLAQL